MTSTCGPYVRNDYYGINIKAFHSYRDEAFLNKFQALHVVYIEGIRCHGGL